MILNIPPVNIGGSFGVEPQPGSSIFDDFIFRVMGMKDDDRPLVYQYQIYMKKGDYQKDIEGGSNPLEANQIFLTDILRENMYKSILPRGIYNETTDKYEMLLLVSVYDSLGAQNNVTTVIEVKPATFGGRTDIEILEKIELILNDALD